MIQSCILLLIAVICLIGLFYSLKNITILTSTEQESSKLTGFPIWYSEIIDQQISASTALAPMILIFVSTIVSLIYAHKKSVPKAYISYFTFPNYPKNKPSDITTKSFNKSLAYYTLFTFITNLTLYILEPGKLWSSLSSFQNLLELIIILFLTLEGQFHENRFLIFICSSYILLVNLLTISLKWPLDFIWFKTQDLVFDFALVIVFLRIYRHTNFYIKKNRPSLLPTVDNTTTQNSQLTKENDEEVKPLRFIYYLGQVILLPLAAFVHLSGNITALVIAGNKNLTLLLSNTVAFSMYAFYIYLDTHYASNTSDSKKIVLPYTSDWKILFIFLCSTILSISTIRLTLLRKENLAKE